MNLIPMTDKAWLDALLTWVLAGPETDQRETKRVSRKMVGKALETVYALANTQGGWLVLGLQAAQTLGRPGAAGPRPSSRQAKHGLSEADFERK